MLTCASQLQVTEDILISLSMFGKLSGKGLFQCEGNNLFYRVPCRI